MLGTFAPFYPWSSYFQCFQVISLFQIVKVWYNTHLNSKCNPIFLLEDYQSWKCDADYEPSDNSNFSFHVGADILNVAYDLSGYGFESRCCHLNFKYGACFEQGVPWHSGKL